MKTILRLFVYLVTMPLATILVALCLASAWQAGTGRPLLATSLLAVPAAIFAGLTGLLRSFGPPLVPDPERGGESLRDSLYGYRRGVIWIDAAVAGLCIGCLLAGFVAAGFIALTVFYVREDSWILIVPSLAFLGLLTDGLLGFRRLAARVGRPVPDAPGLMLAISSVLVLVALAIHGQTVA